ncbi:RNA polymerase sigma factor [Croceiramulus getboli]|nr:sigma-70 family RNA polymerase sigma factor [Flavobacteriaceae bacterium YJPT1-3]
MKVITFYSDERKLIKRAARGEREAQRQLYDQFAPKMLSVCRRYLPVLTQAEEAMCNGFLKVFLNLKSFRNEGSFEGWIRRIMVRESISYLRTQKKIYFVEDGLEKVEAPYASAHSELDVEYIQVLIDGLPEGYRMVFVMYAIEGYKHREIAEELGISESTSKSQLFKARALLQKQLNEQNNRTYGTD